MSPENDGEAGRASQAAVSMSIGSSSKLGSRSSSSSSSRVRSMRGPEPCHLGESAKEIPLMCSRSSFEGVSERAARASEPRRGVDVGVEDATKELIHRGRGGRE